MTSRVRANHLYLESFLTHARVYREWWEDGIRGLYLGSDCMTRLSSVSWYRLIVFSNAATKTRN